MIRKLGFILFAAMMLLGCSPFQVEEKANIYPLTGLPAEEPADNRIISVMINNHTAARPQSGLSEADIVFELLVEGNITRFLALYHSELPEVTGPVRSARKYYVDLANRYDTLYVYHGATDAINRLIEREGTDFLSGTYYDNDGHLFKRESFRVAPHNSYLQMNAVYDVAEEKGYPTTAAYEPLPFLDEEEIAAIDGEPAHHIEISYGTQDHVEFIYDSASGNYKRYSGGSETVELDSGEAITADNVFIIEAAHDFNNESGHRIIDTESGGSAYLIQKGKVQPAEWKSEGGRIVPAIDGETIGFVPGKTWINVIPDLDAAVTISE